MQEYNTPEGKVLSRDLTHQLNTAIQFLVECRPLSVSMGNAIKFVKLQARSGLLCGMFHTCVSMCGSPDIPIFWQSEQGCSFYLSLMSVCSIYSMNCCGLDRSAKWIQARHRRMQRRLLLRGLTRTFRCIPTSLLWAYPCCTCILLAASPLHICEQSSPVCKDAHTLAVKYEGSLEWCQDDTPAGEDRLC